MKKTITVLSMLLISLVAQGQVKKEAINSSNNYALIFEGQIINQNNPYSYW